MKNPVERNFLLIAIGFSVLALAALPAALFSLWHNVSGISLATLLRRTDRKR